MAWIIRGIINFISHIFTGPPPPPPPSPKRTPIPKRVRDGVWQKYHGNGYGVCYTCGCRLDPSIPRGWHCSHVISDNMGGQPTIENLRTCCPHCNLSMGDQCLYAYIASKNLHGPGRRNVNAYFKAHPEQRNSQRTNNWGK